MLIESFLGQAQLPELTIDHYGLHVVSAYALLPYGAIQIEYTKVFEYESILVRSTVRAAVALKTLRSA